MKIQLLQLDLASTMIVHLEKLLGIFSMIYARIFFLRFLS